MGDPTTTGFTSAASLKACVKLCDLAAAQCHAFAKRSASCFFQWNNQESVFGRANCAIVTSTPADLKICNANVATNHIGIVGEIKAELTTGLSECDGWKATCEATCAL